MRSSASQAPSETPGMAAEAEARIDAIRRKVGLWLGPTVFVVMLLLPLELTPMAQRMAAVCAMTVVFWVTEAIPLAAAALLGPALAVVLGIASAKQAFAPFANPLIFLFLGGFLLAEGLSQQGFDRRAALWLITRKVVAGSPARATAAVAVIAYAFSMWISNTATTAMLIPVALGLHATMRRVAQHDDDLARRFDRYGGVMCLVLAYAASIGGIATPIGTGPNVIAMGLLQSNLGVRIDFLHWMTFATPISLVMLVLLLLVAKRVAPPPVERLEGLTHAVQSQLSALGALRNGERRAVGVFILAILGWVAPSLLRLVLGGDHPAVTWSIEGMNEGVVAIVAASLLFVLPSENRKPLLSWQRAHNIDWGTLFLLGGGLALGDLVFTTGLAQAMGEGVLSLMGDAAMHPLGLMAAATLLVLVLTELTSNTATTTMMLPVVIGLASAANVDAVPTAVCVTLAASFAFLLPVSTPPNAMAYGTGLVRIDTMMRTGATLDVLGYLVLLIAGATVVPWLL